MPSSTSSSEPRPASPWRVALAILAGLLIVEGAVSTLPGEGPGLLMRQALQELEPSPGQVLVLGDSTVRNGIEAKLLAERIGRPVATSWFPGTQSWVGVAHLLQERLAAGPPPAAVVLMFSPYSMRDELNPDFYARNFAQSGEVAALWRDGVIETSTALELLLETNLPSLRRRQAIRRLLTAAAAPIPTPPPAARKRTRTLRPPPASGSRPHRQFGRNVEGARRRLQDLPLPPAPHVRFFLERAVDAAVARGVPVILVPGPLYEKVFVTPREQAFFRAGVSFLGDVAARRPGVSLLFREIELFRKEEMANNHLHVNATGRARLTATIAGRICASSPALLPGGCRPGG